MPVMPVPAGMLGVALAVFMGLTGAAVAKDKANQASNAVNPAISVPQFAPSLLTPAVSVPVAPAVSVPVAPSVPQVISVQPAARNMSVPVLSPGIEKAVGAAKLDKVDKLDKLDNVDKLDKLDKPDKLDKVDKLDKPTNLDKVAKDDIGVKTDTSTRTDTKLSTNATEASRSTQSGASTMTQAIANAGLLVPPPSCR
jgi:hypothetical protein